LFSLRFLAVFASLREKKDISRQARKARKEIQEKTGEAGYGLTRELCVLGFIGS
jgi:hypothetical protein